jgi:hypothetical protein
LILKDFKSFEPEVLILLDFKSLFPEVLIRAGITPFVISEMQKIGIFLEVLILGDLGGAICANGWKQAGEKWQDESHAIAKFSRREAKRWVCSMVTL